MISRVRFLSACCMALFLVCSCASNRITPQQEIDSSIATTTWLDHYYGIIDHRNTSKLLNRMTNRLRKASNAVALQPQNGIEKPHQFRTYPWQVFVLDIAEPNAFSAGAGAIFVTRGLIRSLDSEAALAAVLSHEIAHQMLGHTTEALKEISAQSSTPVFSFSIERELDADSLSLRVMRAARYNPEAALSAFSIAYRPIGPLGSTDEKEWLTFRAANIYRHLTHLRETLPKTTNSREFSRVKRELLGYK